jgi:hypothetical protein
MRRPLPARRQVTTATTARHGQGKKILAIVDRMTEVSPTDGAVETREDVDGGPGRPTSMAILRAKPAIRAGGLG